MNDSTLLYRQIHPAFLQQGHVSSQAFRPTIKDDNKLSVYNGDLISAKESYDHFTTVIHCQSAGVLAVNVRECLDEDLPVIDDPQTFDEHALIDFTSQSLISKGMVLRKAETLRKFAISRGWRYIHSSSMD